MIGAKKIFTNFSKTTFTWQYDGVPYSFEPGEPIVIEDCKAELFSKHLIDRELTTRGISTGHQVLRDKMFSLCIKNIEIQETDLAKIQAKAIIEKAEAQKQLINKGQELNRLNNFEDDFLEGITPMELQAAQRSEFRAEKQLRTRGEPEVLSKDVTNMEFSKILNLGSESKADEDGLKGEAMLVPNLNRATTV